MKHRFTVMSKTLENDSNFVYFFISCCHSHVFLIKIVLLSPFVSSEASAGRGESAEPDDGELHAVHLENTPAWSQTSNKHQGPCPWPGQHPRSPSDSSVCSSSLRWDQPLHSQESVDHRGRGQTQQHRPQRGQVPRLVQGSAPPPPSPPPDQELRPAPRSTTAASHFQNGFVSHLGGLWSMEQHPHREWRCWIWSHIELVSASACLQPCAHGTRHRCSSPRRSTTAPFGPSG